MILRSPNGVLPRLGSFSASKVPISELSLGQLQTDGRIDCSISIGAITGIRNLPQAAHDCGYQILTTFLPLTNSESICAGVLGSMRGMQPAKRLCVQGSLNFININRSNARGIWLQR
jgi:hypothetical protein